MEHYSISYFVQKMHAGGGFQPIMAKLGIKTKSSIEFNSGSNKALATF